MIETVNTAPEWHSLSYRFLFIGEIDSRFSLA